MSCAEYSRDARATLLGVARDAVEFGVRRGGAIDIDALVSMERLPAQLIEPRATFVTLRKFEALRGCTGSLEARRPLVEDVAANAWHTALHDPRFPGLDFTEFADVRIEISVLSPLRAMEVGSEQDLLERLSPDIGLVIECAGRRATFLPKVWESLPDPRQFLAELKCKAGFPADYWSPSMRVCCYHTETFAEAQ